MANIENNFIPILDKIILPTDEVKALSKEEKRKVALWGFKTSLVINAGSNYRRLAPNEQFQHLYDYKSISKDVQVDLAYIKNYKQLEWQQSPIMFAMGRRLKDDMYQNPLQLKHDSFCIAMQIGNLGIRVSWFKESKNRGYTIISTNQEKTLRIWPYEKNPLFNKQICFEELSEFQMSLSLKDKYS